MASFEIDGVTYRSNKLPVLEQWRLYQLLAPILPAVSGAVFGMSLPQFRVQDLPQILAPLLSASDETLSAVFATCVSACEKKDGEAWGPATAADLMAPSLMSLIVAVATLNFGALISMQRPRFQPTAADSPPFQTVSMPGQEDWVWRPVLRGMCPAGDLFEGKLHIEDIARMNDALDVADENERRAHKAAEKK